MATTLQPPLSPPLDSSRPGSRLMALALAAALLLAGPVTGQAGVEAVFDALPDAHQTSSVRLVSENHDAWYARWHVISKAKRSIDCTYFTVAPDMVGRALLGLLLQKASEGVKIRLMVDNRGAFALSNPIFAKDYLPALATLPNVQIRVYNAFSHMLNALPDYLKAGIASNHSKLVIVDGEWVVAGGRNLQNKWYTAFQDDPKSYRDADILARGASIAGQALRAFEDEYNHLGNSSVKPLKPEQFATAVRPLVTSRDALFARMMGRRSTFEANQSTAFSLPAVHQADGAESLERISIGDELKLFASMRHYAQFQPYPQPSTWPVVLLGKHSAVNPDRVGVTDTLIKLIDGCAEELVIANPYMVLTERAKTALVAAGKRGVKIRYITNSPESTNSMLTQAWFVKEWKEYLRDIPNLRLYALAVKHKWHGKMFAFDRKVSVVGSYNMDPMSEQINAEDIAIIRSPKFCAEALAWIDVVGSDAIEYKIKVNANGSVTQVVGPSDHCSRVTLWILKAIGSLWFLRPVV